MTQGDCYLCLSEAYLKITGVALHLQSSRADTPSVATGTTLKSNIHQSTLLNSTVSDALNKSNLLHENRILACLSGGLLVCN